MVYGEGIQAICGVATVIGTKFKHYMDEFLPFLVSGLTHIDDITLCKICVGCVGDLSRALQSDIVPYLSHIVPILMELLRNPHLDRNIKGYILTMLGDLAMAANKQFLPYLGDVMVVLHTASQLIISKPQDVVIYIYIYIIYQLG